MNNLIDRAMAIHQGNLLDNRKENILRDFLIDVNNRVSFHWAIDAIVEEIRSNFSAKERTEIVRQSMMIMMMEG